MGHFQLYISILMPYIYNREVSDTHFMKTMMSGNHFRVLILWKREMSSAALYWKKLTSQYFSFLQYTLRCKGTNTGIFTMQGK